MSRFYDAMDTMRRSPLAPIDGEALAKVEQIKRLGSDLSIEIANISMQSGTDPRMVALAKTKAEEAVMWAVKAITA